MEDTSRRSEGRRRVSSRYLFCWLPLSPGYYPDTESDRCAPSAVSGTGAHQYPCLLHWGNITLPRDCTYLGLHHQFLPMEVTCVVRSRRVFSRLSLFPHLLTMYRASRGGLWGPTRWLHLDTERAWSPEWPHGADPTCRPTLDCDVSKKVTSIL